MKKKRRGIYLDNITDILGNAEREYNLLDYCLFNNIDYVVFYGLHLIPDYGNNANLAILINKAKSSPYNIKEIGVAGNHEGYENHFSKAVTFNSNFKNHPEYPASFDVLNLESEYWNGETTFTNWLSILAYLSDLAHSNSMLVEAYLGYPSEAEAAQVSLFADRVLLHTYVPSPGDAYDYIANRLKLFSQPSEPTEIWPIFSAEDEALGADNTFMGPWLQDPAHSMTDAQKTFLDEYEGDPLGPPGWKSGINLVGFQYFTYSFLNPAEINVDDLGDCGGEETCLDSIQEAIDAAGIGTEVKVSEGDFYEDLMVQGVKIIKIIGGWGFFQGDVGYSINNFKKTLYIRNKTDLIEGSLNESMGACAIIHGSLTIIGGTVEVENLVFTGVGEI